METVKLAVCGTTCTMAIIMDDDIVIANVGDSRSILFCHKDLRKVLSGVVSEKCQFQSDRSCSKWPVIVKEADDLVEDRFWTVKNI